MIRFSFAAVFFFAITAQATPVLKCIDRSADPSSNINLYIANPTANGNSSDVVFSNPTLPSPRVLGNFLASENRIQFNSSGLHLLRNPEAEAKEGISQEAPLFNHTLADWGDFTAKISNDQRAVFFSVTSLDNSASVRELFACSSLDLPLGSASDLRAYAEQDSQ